MSSILALTSSALGTQSASTLLVRSAVERLRAADPTARLISRDLGVDHIPHLTGDAAAALKSGTAANAEQARALQLSDMLVDELKAADTLVIGAPMYNFGISTTLKAWFDYVLRAGVTFSYGEAGPSGLLTGKRAVVALSRGGVYSEGPHQAVDFQEPHLKWLLSFMGIDDVSIVRAERLGFGPEAREAALAGALREIEALTGGDLRQAA
jgi:FMN-dependent NADH-azoreductase